MHHRNFFVEKGGISAIGRELRQRHNKAQVRTFVQAQLLFVMWWWWCRDSAKGRKYFRLDTFFLFQQQRFFVYIYRYVQKAELSLLWKYVVLVIIVSCHIGAIHEWRLQNKGAGANLWLLITLLLQCRQRGWRSDNCQNLVDVVFGWPLTKKAQTCFCTQRNTGIYRCDGQS